MSLGERKGCKDRFQGRWDEQSIISCFLFEHHILAGSNLKRIASSPLFDTDSQVIRLGL